MHSSCSLFAPLPKIVHPKQPQFAVVANVNLPKYNGRPLLGRSSLIKDDSSARAGAARTQPRYQKLCTPSTRCLRMWRTSAYPGAMAGLCSGDPPS
ncbi:hypothetical protein TNIN_449271 [Trichonephila inaurata madagascariensis]|uniref:Uncharacterized protein n=1 Tax=Trichonephila inaurata madagascariensis TaxID=2747483 RepID=A0A8X6YAG3_9ARAC|nr:hypothetical protein TNIN_449271 [Trichonephila inaurata madagascariensis]